MTEILVLLIIAVFFAGGYALDQRRVQSVNQAWSELARRTGLTFDPGERPFFGQRIQPTISGDYRGRRLSMTKVINYISGGDHGGDVAAVHTRTLLSVLNPGTFSFRLHEKGIIDRLLRINGIASDVSDLDRHFVAQGWPHEFVRSCLGLIVPLRRLLIEHLPGVTMVTDDSFTGTLGGRPSIELEGSELVLLQSGVLTDVDMQMQLVNLLCDLADLAEAMQRRAPIPAAGLR